MPTIAVSVLWLWILNPDLGLLNALLGQIGLPHIPWLTSETLVLPTLILISLWNLGPMMIIFLGLRFRMCRSSSMTPYRWTVAARGRGCGM
jgi:ABC-type sugar transport system permease subunit